MGWENDPYPSPPKNTPMNDAQGTSPIGEGGRTLAEMLEASDHLFAETGHYQGLDELAIKTGDPIHYEKSWSRLRGALVAARETALNISASPIVREIGELCFALYTPEGDSVTLSTGIMAHVHTMSDTIKYMVRSGYETNPRVSPGDIFVNNDPHLGNVHNADVMEILPIFWDSELIGWAAGVTHEIDIGSPKRSSMPRGNVSRFEDGWIISCSKVGAGDQLFTDYRRRCDTAVRLSFHWVLDEKCRLAGCQMIRDAVLRLVAEIGVDAYRAICREFIEDTRRAMVRTIKALLVPGVYQVPNFYDVTHAVDAGRMEPQGAIDSLMHAPLKLSIGADASFTLDLDGANKWGYHSHNCTPSGMQSGLWVGLSQIIAYDDKLNDGAYLATEFNIPFGSWAHPDDLSVSNAAAWSFIIPAFGGLFRAVSQGYAARGYIEEVVAGFTSNGNVMQGGGPNLHGREGSWTNFEMGSCGGSAGLVRDGENCCLSVINPDADMGDVEAWELIEPLLYLGRRLRPQTGGIGKYQGGLGFETLRLVFNTPNQVLSHGGNGHTFNGTGMFGAYPASPIYRHSIKDTDLKERFEKGRPYPVADFDPENSEMSAHVTGTHLKDHNLSHMADMHSEYDLYLSILSGGHGCGDPMEREPEKVVDDLNELLLLPRFAESGYGVIAGRVGDGAWRLDAGATEAKRAEIRAQRLERSIPVAEWIAGQRPKVEKGDHIEPIRRMYAESLSLSENWAAAYRGFWDLPEDWTP